MSLIWGLLVGAAIATLEVVTMHLRIAVGPFMLNEHSIAVPFVLVPVALSCGWTWAAERWSGRAIPRLVLYTLGLFVAMTAAGPLDMLVFWPAIDVPALASLAPDLIAATLVFAPPAAIAALLSWALGSGRLPVNRLTLAVGYLVGPSVALLSPVAAMGTVTGTAAGHAWRSPGARTTIAIAVVVLMAGAAFLLPYALTELGVLTPPARPLLP